MKPRKRLRSTYPEAEAKKLMLEESAVAYGIDREVVNVREAKDQLSRLLDKASQGSQIVITSDGTPKAMIVRFRPAIAGTRWIPHTALRNKTLMSVDSTASIRQERDGGY
jgi:prevent-host-death family protein